MNLSKGLFWDVDFNSLNYKKHSRFIIERVLSRGSLHDWDELKGHYGVDKIKQEVVKIRYLDKRTFNFCHMIFEIPKKEFRCYNTRQSIRKLWNY